MPRDHTIQISDELWRRYDGSPMRMRETLWEAETRREAIPPVADGQVGEVPWGTLFIALRQTECPRCGRPITRGTFAVMTSYANAGGRAIHYTCAESADLDVRWTREKLNEGFRKLLPRGTRS